MTNTEKYQNVFKESFALGDGVKVTTLKYQGMPEWDSVGHMDLIASLEDEFDIMFETDEIIGLDSYERGMEMLQAHGIEF